MLHSSLSIVYLMKQQEKSIMDEGKKKNKTLLWNTFHTQTLCKTYIGLEFSV